jgi:hypothetical protein
MVSYMPWQERSFSTEPSVCRSKTRATRKIILTPAGSERRARGKKDQAQDLDLFHLGGLTAPCLLPTFQMRLLRPEEGNELLWVSGSWEGQQALDWWLDRDQACFSSLQATYGEALAKQVLLSLYH